MLVNHPKRAKRDTQTDSDENYSDVTKRTLRLEYVTKLPLDIERLKINEKSTKKKEFPSSCRARYDSMC
jgi:hypothetical protein